MAAVVITPPPIVFGSMRVGDVDSRAMTWAPDLVPDNDTIASVTAVTITRKDGVGMTGTDLAWTPPASLDAGKLIVTFGLQFGTAGVTYVVTVKILTTSGRVLLRDGFLLVAARLG